MCDGKIWPILDQRGVPAICRSAMPSRVRGTSVLLKLYRDGLLYLLYVEPYGFWMDRLASKWPGDSWRGRYHLQLVHSQYSVSDSRFRPPETIKEIPLC